MQQVLNKKQKLNSNYEVQFFIGGNSYFQKYRVIGNDGKSYLLKLFNSSKLTGFDFSNSNLLEVEILATVNLSGVIHLVNNGELIIENQKYHYIVFNFIPGETISDKLMREGTFSPYSAVPIIIELLNSVKELHTHPKCIIHNNINGVFNHLP